MGELISVKCVDVFVQQYDYSCGSPGTGALLAGEHIEVEHWPEILGRRRYCTLNVWILALGSPSLITASRNGINEKLKNVSCEYDRLNG